MSLKISNPLERMITVGHGEYIIYHQKETGEKLAPSKKTFKKAYAVLNHFNSPTIDNRYEVIRKKVKSIDPSLEITFVPRTYYEMHFLQQAIKEDLKREDFCQNEHKEPDPYSPNNKKDCWHISYFKNCSRNESDFEEDNNAKAVKVLAFNMNQSLFKKVQKHSKDLSFTFKTISDLTDKKIKFFRNFYDTFDLKTQRCNDKFISSTFGEDTAVEKFSKYSDDTRQHPMGIRNEKDAQIFQNAVALECHTIAERSFLLYRGSDFHTDLPYSPNNYNEPYSYSFGPSLLAGAMNCGGAASIVYARGSEDGYVMVIAAQDPKIELIDIPNKHTICNLTTARDVVFHPRSKVWQTNGTVWGFGNACEIKNIVEPYFCHLDKETLTDQILDLKNKNVVFLKSSNYETLTLPPAFQPMIHIHASIARGKTLYIRGNEGGLNWQKGQPLVQVDDNHWLYRVSKPFDHLKYKILVDDDTVSGWEEGEDHELKSGNDAVESPCFKMASTPAPRKGTRLSIRCNTNMGNTLKIYGSGPGMTWSNGTSLKNIGEDLWVWDSSEYFVNFEYKIVINDNKWETGPNHRAFYGKKVEVTPHF